MKAFSFRLDSILNYRRYREKCAQRDLANARNEQKSRKTAIEELARERLRIAQKCSHEGSQGIDVARYHLYRSFLAKLNQDLEHAHLSLREGEKNIKAKTELLREKSVGKKTLTMLKDVQLESHMQRSERETQREMDEMVIIRRGGRA